MSPYGPDLFEVLEGQQIAKRSSTMSETRYVYPQDVRDPDRSTLDKMRAGGITLRNHFATHAMLGLVASGRGFDGAGSFLPAGLAEKAFQLADAMLEIASRRPE
jgi:hypothetical protein